MRRAALILKKGRSLMMLYTDIMVTRLQPTNFEVKDIYKQHHTQQGNV